MDMKEKKVSVLIETLDDYVNFLNIMYFFLSELLENVRLMPDLQAAS